MRKQRNCKARSEQNRQRKARRLQAIVSLKKKAKEGNQAAAAELENLSDMKKRFQNVDQYYLAKRTAPRTLNQRQRRKRIRQSNGYYKK